MSRNNSFCTRPVASPPSPPGRSPASGYSKLILSAIKDIPYEPNSSNANRSSAQSVQSPTQPLTEEQPEQTETKIEKEPIEAQPTSTMTTILKIKVGHFKEDAIEKPIEMDLNERQESTRKERRSLSCETALTDSTTPRASLIRIQKANSVNKVNLALNSSVTPPIRSLMLTSPAIPAGCSTIASSKLGSCASIYSASSSAVAFNEINDIQRSPSASSIHSKSGKSIGQGPPKIRISIVSTALYACANGQLQELKELIKENPELINYQYPNCFRYSCLHIAAKAGDLAIVNYLAKNGSNLNAKDTWSTPLHLAAKANQISAVKLLREMGADATIRDAHGMLFSSYLSENAKRDGKLPYLTVNQKQNGKGHAPQFDYTNLEREGDSESLNSNLSQNSLVSRHHNYSFRSLKKPIGRVVREMWHRK